MKSYAIEARKLSRSFGSFRAVDNVSFQVEQGRIFGLLGANGAGKTTLIRMLCGILRASGGEAKVNGYDINNDYESIKQSIGYMSQKFSLYSDLTVGENLEFFGGVYGLSKDQAKERSAWVISMAGLTGREQSITSELSGGFKQRLALGCAVLHNPKLLFLDEPTGGVDPLSRRDFWGLINNLASSGTTIVVTTHYLDEAEYCNQIMLMHAGRAIAMGAPGELKSRYLTNPLVEVLCSNPVGALKLAGQQPWISNVSLFGKKLHIETTRSKQKEIQELLNDQGITIQYLETIAPSLEDVFLHLVTEQQGEQAG